MTGVRHVRRRHTSGSGGRFVLAVLGAMAATPYPARAQSDVAFPADVYASRRARLQREVGDALVVIAGRYLVSPGDELVKQDPSFWYLTGVESPWAILVMVPPSAATNEAARSLLFLPDAYQFAGGQFPMVDEGFRRAPWNRPVRRLTPGDASRRATGADETIALSEFARRFRALAADARTVYAPVGDEFYAPAGLTAPESFERQFRRSLSSLAPRAELRDVSPLIQRLRLIKDRYEIDALRKAARISGKGLVEAMRSVRPGLNDREIAGLMEYVWKREGSPRSSFPPIVSSGSDAMTFFSLKRELYNPVDRVMRAGELLFVDYGAAEFMTYTSDLCRTLPVSGRFTPEQRKYYDIVLEAQQAAIAEVRPGVMMLDVIKAAAAIYRKHGLEKYEDIARMGEDSVWGIMPSPTHYLSRDAGIVRYSAMGRGVRDLGHHIGLEVQDSRDYSMPLAPGMVVTIEPKIYIPGKNIAIMIEDEILVTSTGHEVLSADTPRTADDVERTMADGRRDRAAR